MCDIYFEPCKVCGKKICMHLGDYLTNRYELFVVCEDCLKHSTFYKPERMVYPSILWESKEEGKVLVVALTRNAWTLRKYNHPNYRKTKIVKEYFKSWLRN